MYISFFLSYINSLINGQPQGVWLWSCSRRSAESPKLQQSAQPSSAIRKSNRLLVVQMKRCAHQLQQAIDQRENMRRDFLLKSEENKHITAECQLQHQDLRRITALKERVWTEKQHLCAQLQCQGITAAQEKEAYTFAISQIWVSFEHMSDFNTDIYFIYVQCTVKHRRDIQPVSSIFHIYLLFIFCILQNNFS